MATVDVTRIASNIGALNALNSLQTINKNLALHQTRLSTGKRINSAADDPAGLTIATKMLARSEGMKVALGNISDANNMLSVAEGGMSKINDILVQMRSKAEQAASDTLGSSERSAIQTQLSAYATQIQDLVDQTKWNGVKLLDTTTGAKTFQTGADEGDSVAWTLADKLDPTSLAVSSNNTTATTTSINFIAASFTGVPTSAGAMSGTSKLDTGTYTVEILDRAAGTTAATAAGKVNVTSLTMPSGISGLAANTTAFSPASELTSGNYSFEITGGTDLAGRTAVSYRVLNAAGTVVGSETNVNMVGAKSLKATTAGNDMGASMTTTGALSTGSKISFEYIARGYMKYELNDASGVAQTVSKNGTDMTGAGLYGYFDATAANTAVNTGRGFTFGTTAMGALQVAGDYASFNYLAAGTNVVDVSTTLKAGTYMTTVNNALDTVNRGMSNLGSLMARLSFKEEAVATAQVNVESSYSRIMNANMAEEQVNASKFTILQQTATAMLAQANQAPQSLLSLFR